MTTNAQIPSIARKRRWTHIVLEKEDIGEPIS
jgi:hypothetical protein